MSYLPSGAVLQQQHALGGSFEVGVCLHPSNQYQVKQATPTQVIRCGNCGHTWAPSQGAVQPTPYLRYTG